MKHLRKKLYKLASILGDLEAASSGSPSKVVKRVKNKVIAQKLNKVWKWPKSKVWKG